MGYWKFLRLRGEGLLELVHGLARLDGLSLVVALAVEHDALVVLLRATISHPTPYSARLTSKSSFSMSRDASLGLASVLASQL